MVIDWAKSKIQIKDPHLHHLIETIKKQIERFGSISFNHVYRELNVEANTLSKSALFLVPGTRGRSGSKLMLKQWFMNKIQTIRKKKTFKVFFVK